jgi:hypothetical protein
MLSEQTAAGLKVVEDLGCEDNVGGGLEVDDGFKRLDFLSGTLGLSCSLNLAFGELEDGGH